MMPWAELAPAFDRHHADAAAWLDAEAVTVGVAVGAPARTALLDWLRARLVACAHTALDAERRRVSPPALVAAGAWPALAAGYPVVARLVESSIATWRGRVARVLADVARDHASLGSPTPAIETVSSHGELLEARRTTLILGLAGGVRWVHRTKDLVAAAWLMELLERLNDSGLSTPLHVRRIHVGDGCSWDEFVASAPCRDPGEIAAFFRRAGMLVGLLERLGATDFHAENVIAAGPHPVLVDIETLFHPEPGSPPPLARALLRSPLRCGLLHAWFFGAPGRAAFPAAGLNAGGPHEVPFPTLRLRSLDSPTGGFEEVFEVVDVPATLPAPLGDGMDDLIAGYRELGERLPADLFGLLGRAADLPVRHIRSDGAVYERLLIESLQPELLHSEAARDAWLGGLGLERTELAALRDLVFPRPHATSSGHSRLGPDEPGDLAFRLDVLETAAALMDDRPAPSRPAAPPPPSPLAAAVAIGDAILAAHFPGAPWPGVAALPWAGVRVLGVLGADLLSGHAGIGLVLAQLHAVTGLARFRAAALAALEHVPQTFARPAFVGGHLGLGGAIYALARAAELLGAPALAARAAPLVSMFPRGPLAAGPWDVITGVAGLVLGMLAVGPPPRAALDALRAAWDRGLASPPLVDGALPPCLPDVATGVAHTLARAGERVPVPADGHLLWRLGIDPAAPAAAARALATSGSDLLDELELALTAHGATGDAAFAAAAHGRAAALIERRRSTGLWFPATRVAERFNLSAVTGLPAIAHALLRLEAPQIVRGLRRLE